MRPTTDDTPPAEVSAGLVPHDSARRVLWQPDRALVERSNLTAFRDWLEINYGLRFEDYPSLWRWSVTELETFWQAIWEYFDVEGEPAERVLASRAMPFTRWFEGATLNYAEHALRRRAEETCVVAVREDGWRQSFTQRELADLVARCQNGLRGLGVGPGDRIVAYVSNGIEALVAFLASASLGAVWSSCPPEFGTESVLDRFRQIEPKVLLAVDGYPHGGKWFERSVQVERIRAGLPSLSATVFIARRPPAGSALATPSSMASSADVHTWDALLAQPGKLHFERVEFSHPLWVLYSSGTTGLPKAIIHGHGGILLEHFKQLSFHHDLKPADRFFWYSTTGWMMWNYLIGGLLVGATVVLYEGSPGYPDLMALWRMAASEKVTYFGVSAPFLMACRAAGLKPGRDVDLSAITGVGSTGAPLPPEGFDWVYEQVGGQLLLGSVSGGTDLCTAFVGSCPWLPVVAGELQCKQLGAAVEAFDPAGKSVLDEVGELVLTQPMPSMPLGLWNDAGGKRLREAYFSEYPGVWRHGDWIRLHASGGIVISGRSDATLNRGGVRMGSAEFYRVVEALDFVQEALVVDTANAEQRGTLWLFVSLVPGIEWTQDLLREIKTALATQLSPRHVPDEIRRVSAIPRTLSGKKLEVPVKRLLSGAPLAEVASPGTLQNPEALAALLRAASHKPEETA